MPLVQSCHCILQSLNISMAGDSSDSNEENEGKPSVQNCPHVGKAIQFNAIRKVLNRDGYPRECSACRRANRDGITNGHVEELDDEDIYICLRCGVNGCHRHAELHEKNTQSDAHDIAFNTQKFSVRCFKCNVGLPKDASKQLLECVEFLRKKNVSIVGQKEDLDSGDVPDVNKVSYTGIFYVTPVASNSRTLPRIRGLANLGNTCFMNATLQCLAQTPFLLPVLEDMEHGGEKFRLPGGDIKIGEDTVPLNPLEGTLKEWGTLTAALADTLRELQSGREDVFVPSRLRKVLEEKCPQFAGYVQHDAHELLRQLLDTVRTEDLKRYQAAILQLLNLDKKSERDALTERQHLVVKGYGRQAGELMLKPSEVFRGELVSTLVCQRCRHATDHIEYFLDLSLPVVADKPVHVRRRNNSEEGRDVNHKYQRKAMRRRRGNKKSNTNEGAAEAAQDADENRASDASDEDSEARGRDDLHTRPEGGDNSAIQLPRPQSCALAERCSPVLTDNGHLELKGRLGESDQEDQACSASRGSESADGESDVPNLGSDDNQCNGILADLDSTPNEREDDAAEARPDVDVGESGYSSEKPANGNSACVSPSSALDLCGLRVTGDTSGAEACAGTTLAPRVYVSSGECTLITCLNQFTAQELLTGNNKVGCESCTERAHGKGGKTLYMDASKQLLVLTPPAILILHLKRFQVFSFTSRKNSEEVTFKPILDLAPYCSAKCKNSLVVRKDQSEVRYSLYGVVQHSGGMHGGHYVAYVKVRPHVTREDPRWNFLPGGKALPNQSGNPPEPPPGNWYYASDSNVQEVSESRVLSSEAYLLFYERIW